MCTASKSKLSPSELEMEAKFQENNKRFSCKNCSNLLELAATDDLAGFIYAIEEMCSDVNEVSYWYGRTFGTKKMGYEERTPMMIASLFGSLEVLKYIVGTGKVDVNRVCGSDGATPLHCAAASGSWASVEVVKFLIGVSGDINSIDVYGKKPCDLIAPCVKFSSNSKRRILDMLLKGIEIESGDEEEEGSEIPRVKEGGEKKEYPVDVSLPDINDGIYGSDEFRMYSFKVKPCSRAYSHDWTECPFVHPGENARRRDLRKHHYTCVPCPEFKKGSCAKGDSCEYAHGVFESWLHPAQYRTRLCKDETGCARKVCFFAHKPEELRPLYAATGSAMPSPNPVSMNSMGMTSLSPLSLGSSSLMLPNTSTPPMSPSVTCSSPMGGNMWQNKVNLITPPALQLPGSRLKTTFSARNVDFEVELLELEKIRTQNQRQQLIEEMASLSSPYQRTSDLKPTNLDDIFGSLDPSLLSQLQGLSPKNSPTSHQIRQNTNQLRASYPANYSSSSAAPARKQPSAYGFDSSAAVAAAVMNSRANAFSKRSQSFIDRGTGVGYRSSLSSSANSPGPPMPSMFSDWNSPNGKVNWGFDDDEVNKLRKSASFGFRSNNANASAAMAPCTVDEPDVSWVNSLVKDTPSDGIGPHDTEQSLRGGIHEMAPSWIDQLYMEQEQMQMVA